MITIVIEAYTHLAECMPYHLYGHSTCHVQVVQDNIIIEYIT